jgi:molecular chaperone GrpE
MAENEENSPDTVTTTEQGTQTPQQEIDALKAERDGLYDRLLRKQAEFDNYKKRVDREKSEFMQFASADLMKELLNALDSYELALKNAATQKGGESMLRGFELIHKQIQDTLSRFGLKAIEAKGKTFDPNFHQAVATQPTDEVEENTVIEEMRKGYQLNGRLLRPAMVSVAAKKE